MPSAVDLVRELIRLRGTSVAERVEERLREFERIGRSGERAWMRELAFCLLAANFSGVAAYEMAVGLDESSLLWEGEEGEIEAFLRRAGHRFPAARAGFIVGARERIGWVRRVIPRLPSGEARDVLRREIRGIGMKEASHFLRNVGRRDLAILDRHVLSLMEEYGVARRPRSLTRRRYLELEGALRGVVEAAGMSMAEADLYLWYMRKGFVFR